MTVSKWKRRIRGAICAAGSLALARMADDRATLGSGPRTVGTRSLLGRGRD